MMCGCGFPAYYARYVNAGRREGVREGRKQGGKLEWAAVPVLRRRRLNLKAQTIVLLSLLFGLAKK